MIESYEHLCRGYRYDRETGTWRHGLDDRAVTDPGEIRSLAVRVIERRGWQGMWELARIGTDAWLEPIRSIVAEFAAQDRAAPTEYDRFIAAILGTRFATRNRDGFRVYLSAEYGSATARDEAMAAAQQSAEYRTRGWLTVPV